MSLRNNDWIKVAAIIALATLFLPSPSWSQTDWLQRGRELFGVHEKSPDAVTISQVAAGLKEALRVGSDNVVGRLGRPDGFAADPAVHIPLPKSLQTVQPTLKPLGMTCLLEDLELKLNRAAEQATPKAKELFLTAIEQMTLDDAMGIYNGPPDAATRYFQGKMSAPLGEEMRPIVEETLAQAGAVQAYDNVMGKYRNVPFAPDVPT